MIPIDAPHDNEVFLSFEEKEMIDGVLNDAKMFNLRKRGYEAGIDFNESDEITELLAKSSPGKRLKTATFGNDNELELDAMEK